MQSVYRNVFFLLNNLILMVSNCFFLKKKKKAEDGAEQNKNTSEQKQGPLTSLEISISLKRPLKPTSIQ